MTGQNRRPSNKTLARPLRVGLLGSPYDWGSLDMEAFRQDGVELTLTSFAGTRDANEQDLLIRLSEQDSGTITHNEDNVIELEIARSNIHQITPQWLVGQFHTIGHNLIDQILSSMQKDVSKYMDTEAIISRYGKQAIRVGSLMGKPLIHIENEALAYLLKTPWRNELELDYLIAWMVFNLEGDVLRKTYVQNSAYEFGTSVRGVSNSSNFQWLMATFVMELISQTGVRTATQVLEVKIPSGNVATKDDRVPLRAKKAA